MRNKEFVPQSPETLEVVLSRIEYYSGVIENCVKAMRDRKIELIEVSHFKSVGRMMMEFKRFTSSVQEALDKELERIGMFGGGGNDPGNESVEKPAINGTKLVQRKKRKLS